MISTRQNKFYRGVLKQIRALQGPGIFLDGNFGDEIIASEREEDIYHALGLTYRDPTGREQLS